MSAGSKALSLLGVIWLASMLVCLPGCVQASEQVGLRVTGFVLDAETQLPLEDAQLSLRSDTLDLGMGLSDSEGRFTIDVVTDATHAQVRAEKTDYTGVETTVFFDSPIRRVDLELRPAL